MRYYLDTNIFIFILFRENENLHFSIRKILNDYSNSFLVSSIVVKEVLFLFRIGKLKSKFYRNESDLQIAMKKLGIETVLFSDNHLKKYFQLIISENHKDMNDHSIISQSLSDKIPLISSDSKFKEYEQQGLNFIYNKR